MDEPGEGGSPALDRTIPLDRPLDLRLTLGPLRHGAGDPTIALDPRRVIRAVRTPEGPGTVAYDLAEGAIRVRAWGAGAAWLAGRAELDLGLGDDPGALLALDPPHPLVRELARRFAGLRFGRTGRVLDALLPAILEQKVTGTEAHRAWRALVLRHGEPAPGPFALRLAPAPATVAGLPAFAFHRLGVEGQRAGRVRRAAERAAWLEAAAALPLHTAYQRLTALPGIGTWTAAEVGRTAFGDPDAVSVGDFHVPNTVCWALAGEPRGDDARMLELLEPYRGQRGRVVRLLEAAGIHAPRRGPRLTPRRIEAI